MRIKSYWEALKEEMCLEALEIMAFEEGGTNHKERNWDLVLLKDNWSPGIMKVIEVLGLDSE